MGFWNTLKKVVTAPQHIQAKATKKIGDILEKSNIGIIYELGWALQDLSEKIEPKCYREEKSTTAEVIDVSVHCKQYYNEATSKTNKKLNQQIQLSISTIQEVKSQLQLLLPLEVFLRVKNTIPDKLYDSIQQNVNDTISEKISLSNDKFKSLLGINSDDERKNQCREYIAKIMEETLNHASIAITEENNNIIKAMLSEAKNYLDQVEADLVSSKNEQLELYSQKDNVDYIAERFSKKATDIAYISCILSETENI